MQKKIPYYILLHLVIFMWGFTGIIGKLIDLNALTLVWGRVCIALISLLIYAYFAKIDLRIKSKKQLIWVIFGGIFVTIHWLTFYHSIILSTASLGILCLSTATIHVTWLAPLLLKQKFSILDLALSSIVIVGIILVAQGFDSEKQTALIYGLFSAFSAALFSVINAKLSNYGMPSSKITIYEMLTGVVVLSCYLLSTSSFDPHLKVMTNSEWGWLLFLGICCTSFAFIACIELIKKLGIFTVSLSINLEPIYTIGLAVIILNEDKLLNTNFYIGALIILAALLVNGILKSFLKKDNV